MCAGYVRHPMDGGLLMAAFGLAVITRNETRLALAALLWFLLEKKVRHGARLAARPLFPVPAHACGCWVGCQRMAGRGVAV